MLQTGLETGTGAQGTNDFVGAAQQAVDSPAMQQANSAAAKQASCHS
jgi:hypothetical protein